MCDRHGNCDGGDGETTLELSVSSEMQRCSINDPEEIVKEETTSSLAPLVATSRVHIFKACNKIQQFITAICLAANANEIVLNKESVSRLRYLNDTVALIVNYYSTQTSDALNHPAHNQLTTLILKRLNDLKGMLRQIRKYETPLTENFDIFELKLRGALEEIRTLFPKNKKIPKPYEVIDEIAARKHWVDGLGENTYFVGFQQLLTMLESMKLFKPNVSGYSETVSLLQYFVGYPADELITTYKWNQLIHLFGSSCMLYDNICKFACGAGFLGLINRIQAFEILSKTISTRIFLIRNSRTEPQFLAFSYKNSKGIIRHQVNKDSVTGRPIPVSEFVAKKFPSYTLVPRKVDLEKILMTSNMPEPLTEYAKRGCGYF